MDFQIDFGNVGAPSPARDVPLFASVDGIVSPLGPDECVFEVRGGGDVHVMTAQVVRSLDLCRQFRSLDEHAAVVAQHVPGLSGQQAAVRRVIDSLVARKLMTGAAEYLEVIGSSPSSPPAPLRAAYIRACDRPAQLARLLESLAADPGARATVPRVVVLDDSRHAVHVRANAQAIAERRKSGFDIVHVDPARWQALTERLEKSVPAAAAAARHALARQDAQGPRPGGGKGYNLAALLSAGAGYALLDEDFVLPLLRHPEGHNGLDLLGSPDMPVRFHGSADGAMADGVAPAEDPWARYAALIGQPLGRVLGTAGLKPPLHALSGFAPSRWPHLGPHTRVVAVCNGHRGHSGSANNDWLYLLDAASRAKLCADREQYLRTLDGPAVWFGPPRARILREGHFTPFLVDAGNMLPPTMPSGRSEDLLFGLLCRALEPTGVVLHTDLAIGHVQEGRRDRDARPVPDTPGFNQFLNDFLATRLAELRAAGRDARLATLAAWLRDVAAAPAAVRVDLLDEYVRFRRADLIQRLQHAFEAAPDAPVSWHADVRERITVNGRALAEKSAPRLGGWPATLDEAGCADHLARELDAFATTLAQWPLLWTHARESASRWLGA
jgi:hypothetical protein